MESPSDRNPHARACTHFFSTARAMGRAITLLLAPSIHLFFVTRLTLMLRRAVPFSFSNRLEIMVSTLASTFLRATLTHAFLLQARGLQKAQSQ